MGSSRASGILLHPTSLPGPFGVGDLGPEAYAFANFLVASGQSLWQVFHWDQRAMVIHPMPATRPLPVIRYSSVPSSFLMRVSLQKRISPAFLPHLQGVLILSLFTNPKMPC